MVAVLAPGPPAVGAAGSCPLRGGLQPGLLLGGTNWQGAVLPTGVRAARPQGRFRRRQRVTSVYSASKGGISVRQVMTMDELRAAAALRVEAFYQYPGDARGYVEPLAPDRDREAREAWKRGKHRSEVERGRTLSNLEMRVVTLVATEDVSEGEGEEELGCTWGLEGRDLLALDDDGRRMRAVGTLDIHVGAALPGELLVGDWPPAAPDGSLPEGHGVYRKFFATGWRRPEDVLLQVQMGRGYIFNLCVLESARRRGVATSLMRQGSLTSADLGVEALYVHVEEHNQGAIALYESLGYQLEKEETEKVAREKGRPRRLLMRADLGRSRPEEGTGVAGCAPGAPATSG